MKPADGCLTPGDLPEDIVRLLFEMAAETHREGLACATVSKQVQSWVEPVLYRDVIVDRAGFFHRTVTASGSTKPSNFFATHVKCLLFGGDIREPSKVSAILERCSSVRSLAFWMPTADWDTPLKEFLSSGILAPTHLSVPRGLFGPTGKPAFSHPIFRNVTHLNVVWLGEGDHWEWDTLAELHTMTHLHIDVFNFFIDNPVEQIQDILDRCPPSLRTFIFFSETLKHGSKDAGRGILAIDKGEVNSRVVLASASSFTLDDALGKRHYALTISNTDVYDDWGRPSTCRTTVWGRAGTVVRQRRLDHGLGRSAVGGPEQGD